MCELTSLRDVGTFVRAKAFKDQRAVVAYGAHVKLHHQAVLDAHPRAFHDHVGGEATGIGRSGLTIQGLLENRLGLGGAQLGCVGRLGSVVRSRGAHALEEGAPVFNRLDKGRIGVDLDPADFCQGLDVGLPTGGQ